MNFQSLRPIHCTGRIVWVVLGFLLFACSSSGGPAIRLSRDNPVIGTQVASTVNADRTQIASTLTPPPTSAYHMPLFVVGPSPRPSATSSPAPRTPLTPTPSITMTPSPEPPTLTFTPMPCNFAYFVQNITVPDGTVMAPGEKFRKIWRLMNLGTCPWTFQYLIIYAEGNQMSAKDNTVMPAVIAPGNTVDIALDMVAPKTVGYIHSGWMIKAPNGQIFGVGPYSVEPFSVNIYVRSNTTGTATKAGTGTSAATTAAPSATSKPAATTAGPTSTATPSPSISPTPSPTVPSLTPTPSPTNQPPVGQTVIRYRRENSSTGMCDDLVITFTGHTSPEAQGSSCGGTYYGAYQLTAAQLAQVTAWYNAIQTFDATRTPPYPQNQTTTRIQFTGMGANLYTEQDFQSMKALCDQILTYMPHSR